LGRGRLAIPPKRAVATQLHHDGPRTGRRHRGDELFRLGVEIRAGDERELVGTAEDDVDAGGEVAQQRGCLFVGPEASSHIDIKAHRRACSATLLECARRGGACRVGQCGRDPGEVQPPDAFEDPVIDGPYHVLRCQSRARRPGSVIDDVHRAEDTALAEHHAGPGAVVDRQMTDVDSLAAQCTEDRRPEPVASYSPDVRDGVSQTGEPDGDVRLRARDMSREPARLGEGPRVRGDERRETFAEGDDLRRVLTCHGGHHARRTCAMSRSLVILAPANPDRLLETDGRPDPRS